MYKQAAGAACDGSYFPSDLERWACGGCCFSMGHDRLGRTIHNTCHCDCGIPHCMHRASSQGKAAYLYTDRPWSLDCMFCEYMCQPGTQGLLVTQPLLFPILYLLLLKLKFWCAVFDIYFYVVGVQHSIIDWW